MKYIITTPNRKVYIKLSKSGKVQTCPKSEKQLFDHSKACNILANLPTTLKKFHFNVVALSNIEKNEDTSKQEIIINDNYILPDEIKEWERRVINFNNLMNDATMRKKELEQAYINIEKIKCDILHEIELNKNLNVCDGYKKYESLRTALRERRKIKDELKIVNFILQSIPLCNSLKDIKEKIDGLSNRVYEIRKVK